MVNAFVYVSIKSKISHKPYNPWNLTHWCAWDVITVPRLILGGRGGGGVYKRILISQTIIFFKFLAPVVQTSDSAIHRINHYPVDSVIIDFRNTYPLDSDLPGG